MASLTRRPIDDLQTKSENDHLPKRGQTESPNPIHFNEDAVGWIKNKPSSKETIKPIETLDEKPQTAIKSTNTVSEKPKDAKQHTATKSRPKSFPAVTDVKLPEGNQSETTGSKSRPVSVCAEVNDKKDNCIIS